MDEFLIIRDLNGGYKHVIELPKGALESMNFDQFNRIIDALNISLLEPNRKAPQKEQG